MLQVAFRIDAIFREYAFVRTASRYCWQRIRRSLAERLIALGVAEMID